MRSNSSLSGMCSAYAMWYVTVTHRGGNNDTPDYTTHQANSRPPEPLIDNTLEEYCHEEKLQTLMIENSWPVVILHDALPQIPYMIIVTTIQYHNQMKTFSSASDPSSLNTAYLYKWSCDHVLDHVITHLFLSFLPSSLDAGRIIARYGPSTYKGGLPSWWAGL